MQKIPILKIGKNLIVSLQYDVDDKTALQLQSDLLQTISKTSATGVLIELSALDMVDSFMGRIISDISKMSASMNANTVVVGIQPSVAITLVELGLKLEQVYTVLNIEDGIELLTDLDRQDIIVLNLERAVQLCVDIAAHAIAGCEGRPPQTMAEGFLRLHEEGIISQKVADRMQKTVGFRNIAVHEYQILNWNAVFAIITKHLDDFRIFAQEVMQWLEATKKV